MEDVSSPTQEENDAVAGINNIVRFLLLFHSYSIYGILGILQT